MTFSVDRRSRVVPRKRPKHHSYDESVDEPAKLLEQEPVEIEEEIPAEAHGAPISVGFNARYLMDVLQAVETDDVAFDINDDMSPGVLRPAGDTSYTAVVMPVRI